MTQPTPNQAELRELLTRRLDGQLAGDQASAFESALRDAGPDSDLALDAARGSALRDLLADVPTGLDVDSPGDLAFERVRRNIQAATTGVAADAAPAAKRRARAGSGAATRSQPGRAMYGGLVAVAAAAAVALVSFGPGPSVGVPSVPGTSASNGTEIVHVEFGKVSGTYWEQSEGSDRVAIVWIDDTVIEEVGRP